MSDQEQLDLVELTAELASVFLANNSATPQDVPTLIATIYETLSTLGQEPAPAQAAKPTPAVSQRQSMKDPARLVSMIDGKPYTSLKRHIGRHGYTPESYREAFDLPSTYPMVAPAYSEHRRKLAHEIGLGRKAATETAEPKPAAKRSRLKVNHGAADAEQG